MSEWIMKSPATRIGIVSFVTSLLLPVAATAQSTTVDVFQPTYKRVLISSDVGGSQLLSDDPNFANVPWVWEVAKTYPQFNTTCISADPKGSCASKMTFSESTTLTYGLSASFTNLANIFFLLPNGGPTFSYSVTRTVSIEQDAFLDNGYSAALYLIDATKDISNAHVRGVGYWDSIHAAFGHAWTVYDWHPNDTSQTWSGTIKASYRMLVCIAKTEDMPAFVAGDKLTGTCKPGNIANSSYADVPISNLR